MTLYQLLMSRHPRLANRRIYDYKVISPVSLDDEPEITVRIQFDDARDKPEKFTFSVKPDA